VVGLDNEGFLSPYQIWVPVVQALYYSQELPLVDIVVLLCGGKGGRKVCDRVSWTASTTSSITSSKSKVPQVNPVIRPARDPEKQGAHAKPSGDWVPRDQTKNQSPDSSRVLTCDKS
jgi:hypothetical protein